MRVLGHFLNSRQTMDEKHKQLFIDLSQCVDVWKLNPFLLTLTSLRFHHLAEVQSLLLLWRVRFPQDSVQDLCTSAIWPVSWHKNQTWKVEAGLHKIHWTNNGLSWDANCRFKGRLTLQTSRTTRAMSGMNSKEKRLRSISAMRSTGPEKRNKRWSWLFLLMSNNWTW